MKWPFKTIKQQSEWPFHPFLVQLAAVIQSADSSDRVPLATKTIERCVRLGAKLAVEFGMPPCVFLSIAEEQMVREGGARAKAHIADHKAEQTETVLTQIKTADTLVDDLFASLKSGIQGGDEPN